MATSSRPQLFPRGIVASSGLSLGAILGIAAGGAVALFISLTVLGIVIIRRKYRAKKRRISEHIEHGHVDMKTTVQPSVSRVSRSQRLSINPFLPLDDGIPSSWLAQEGPYDHPQVSKIRQLSYQRGLFRLTRARYSWPLNAAHVPLTLRQGQANIKFSQVAIPGYVIQEPKWPPRSASRIERRLSSTLRSRNTSPIKSRPPPMTPQRPSRRRSASENQLSTILRSTSQRLKAAQRHTRSKTLSYLGQDPGLPPNERLPTPPGKKVKRSHTVAGRSTASREELIDKDYSESFRSSLLNEYRDVAPSPKKQERPSFALSAKMSLRRVCSLSSSIDSLVHQSTPESEAPAALSSPNKESFGSQRRQNRATPTSEVISVIDEKRSSMMTTFSDATTDLSLLNIPQRVSLTSDPFYSSVKSAKACPTPLLGPRPMFYRKATFGSAHETTPEQSPSFTSSPLCIVSGNANAKRSSISQALSSPQTPSKRSGAPSPPTPSDSDFSEPNPFKWDPQDAIQAMRVPSHARRSKKGHKRSSIVRISTVPSRPRSTGSILDEEPENEQVPLSASIDTLNRRKDITDLPPIPPLRIRSRPGSASPPKSRPGPRPPSSATFSPTVVIPELSPSSARAFDESPILGTRSKVYDETVYSPTLSVCNYYTDAFVRSEDEFFSDRPTSPAINKEVSPSPSPKKHGRSRRRGHNGLAEFGGRTVTTKEILEREEKRAEKTLSVPPPSLSLTGAIPENTASLPANILAPVTSARPLANISSTMYLASMATGAGGPALPLLTMPPPSPSKVNITGPCALPPPVRELLPERKRDMNIFAHSREQSAQSMANISAQDTKGRFRSPPKYSIHASIMMLRHLSNLSLSSEYSIASGEGTSPAPIANMVIPADSPTLPHKTGTNYFAPASENNPARAIPANSLLKSSPQEQVASYESPGPKVPVKTPTKSPWRDLENDDATPSPSLSPILPLEPGNVDHDLPLDPQYRSFPLTNSNRYGQPTKNVISLSRPRDSTTVHRARRKRQFDSEVDRQLTPVREVSSPGGPASSTRQRSSPNRYSPVGPQIIPTGGRQTVPGTGSQSSTNALGILDLRFPRLSHESWNSAAITPPRDKSRKPSEDDFTPGQNRSTLHDSSPTLAVGLDKTATEAEVGLELSALSPLSAPVNEVQRNIHIKNMSETEVRANISPQVTLEVSSRLLARRHQSARHSILGEPVSKSPVHRIRDEAGVGNSGSRPVSNGLYDADGFYKGTPQASPVGSPDKPEGLRNLQKTSDPIDVLERDIELERAKDAKRLSGFVM